MDEHYERKLSLPPFPELTWMGNFWHGFITPSHWSEDSFATKTHRNNSVPIDIYPSEAYKAPSTLQIRAFDFLMTQQDRIFVLLVGAIFEIYPEGRREYKERHGFNYSMNPEESLGFERTYGYRVPDIRNIEDFKSTLRLIQVRIPYQEEGLAAVVFKFDCNWEEENGLDIMVFENNTISFCGPKQFEMANFEKSLYRKLFPDAK